MNNLKEDSQKIGEEVTAVLSGVDLEQMKGFLDLIQGARKIALYGGGREGLMIRALAMRLFHLGYEVSVAGDMTAPGARSGLSGSHTTCSSPSRSRRSMKITPPWSRLLFTHPESVTDWPMSAGRSCWQE